MAESRIVQLFAEDTGHERFLTALIQRLARDQQTRVRVSIGSARGGHGRALTELRIFRRAITIDPRMGTDILVIAIDANCRGWAAKRKEVGAEIDHDRFTRVVIACPDPHIERWYMADPAALKKALDVSVSLRQRKCERDVYKRDFIEALRAAEHPITLDGAEFASEIVDSMDLFRAGKNDASLKSCIDDLRAALRAR